jgi:mono/diheme cytochrome c family protein
MQTCRGMLTRGALLMGAGVMLAGVTASRVSADDGKAIYEKNCVACHGASGKGDGPAGKMLKPPPGDLATALKGKSDADIAKVIKEGGKAVGKSATMPAYGTKLTDDQIKGLVDYVKGLGK